MAVDDKGPPAWIRYSHLGVQFALILLAAVFGGVQVDKKLSTGGLFTILGTFVGAGIGFYLLYRETQPASRADPGDAGSPHDGARRSDRDPDRPSRRP